MPYEAQFMFPTCGAGGLEVSAELCNGSRIGDALEAAAGELGVEVVRGGTYLAMEGPQFSSFAESELYRSWGCDVIGMTNMPEAKLAREAEICYASLSMVTDFDCWHPNHDNVEVTDIVTGGILTVLRKLDGKTAIR